jgi:hypothetical protein
LIHELVLEDLNGWMNEKLESSKQEALEFLNHEIGIEEEAEEVAEELADIVNVQTREDIERVIDAWLGNGNDGNKRFYVSIEHIPYQSVTRALVAATGVEIAKGPKSLINDDPDSNH